MRAAPDGAAGLEMMGAWRPDVILLDLMMPVMNGYAFREEQRRRAELREIPVIVISASCGRGDWDGGLGPAQILPKPFDLEELLDSLVTTLADSPADSRAA